MGRSHLAQGTDMRSKPIDWRSLVNFRPKGQFQSCLFFHVPPWKAGTGSCLSSFLFQVTYHSDWLVRGRANTWVISPSGGPKWIECGFQMGYKATNTDLTEVKGILRPCSLASSFIDGTTTTGRGRVTCLRSSKNKCQSRGQTPVPKAHAWPRSFSLTWNTEVPIVCGQCPHVPALLAQLNHAVSK